MHNFLKQTFVSVIGTLLALLIFFGIGIGGLLLLLIALAPKAAQIQDKSMLVFDLSLNITDANSAVSDTGSAIQSALSGQSDDSISLRTVLNTLDRARQDRRIVGIYLDGTKGSGNSSAGLATLREVRAALERFRAAGKTIVAYNLNWSQKEYYLGSVANTIILNPLGEMEVKGLSSQMMFLAGAFQKYGVGVQVVRVGKFKGAVEPYVLTKLSPDNRLQIQQLLDDVWGEWRNSISKSRKLNPQQLQTIAENQGLLTADEAKARGLVDRVAYFDEVLGQLKQLTGSGKAERTFKQVSLTKYADQDSASEATRSSQNKIAVVYAEGDIVDGEGGVTDVGGDRFARALRKLRQDDGVKAVVLRINSPGGSVTAAEVIQREVELTRQVKPVIVSMGDVAASGGYWISADANRIFAEPNTITGSIGVFGLLFDVQKLANNNGITWDVVKTARFADSQTVSRPKTPQELAIYQRSVNRVYDLFLDRVAAGRKLPKPKIAQIAQGRVWSGEEARQIGLVDDIGGLDAAIQYAAREAHLGNDWELKEYPETRSLEQRLLGRMTSDAYEQPTTPADLLTAEFQKLQKELVMLGNMNDPHSIYARLPFTLKID